MRNEYKALPEDERVLSELQNDGADSEDLSPFLTFWRSESSTDPRFRTDRKNGPWMMVDVSPRRRVRRRRPIIARLLSGAYDLLARQPAFGQPVHPPALWQHTVVGPDGDGGGAKAQQIR